VSVFIRQIRSMIELNDFYNNGMGWICRQCDRELAGTDKTPAKHSRVFTEGEAESKTPQLASPALAKWTDKTRRFLTCPRCGITEPVERS
jgi:ribosomal protein L37AE/L43A